MWQLAKRIQNETKYKKKKRLLDENDRNATDKDRQKYFFLDLNIILKNASNIFNAWFYNRAKYNAHAQISLVGPLWRKDNLSEHTMANI